MDFYLANPTPQNWIFRYRLPGVPDTFSLELDNGKQKKIENLEPHEIKSLCSQAEAVGAVSDDRSSTVNDKVTLIYSTAPIAAKRMIKRFEGNYHAIARAGKTYLKSQIAKISENNKKLDGNRIEIDVKEYK